MFLLAQSETIAVVVLYFIDLKFIESVSVPTLGVETVMESFWYLLEVASSTHV